MCFSKNNNKIFAKLVSGGRVVTTEVRGQSDWSQEFGRRRTQIAFEVIDGRLNEFARNCLPIEPLVSFKPMTSAERVVIITTIFAYNPKHIDWRHFFWFGLKQRANHYFKNQLV